MYMHICRDHYDGEWSSLLQPMFRCLESKELHHLKAQTVPLPLPFMNIWCIHFNNKVWNFKVKILSTSKSRLNQCILRTER